METRDIYKQKYEAQLKEWNAKLEELKAHSQKLSAQAKLDFKPHVEGVQSKLDMAKAKLQQVAAATDEKWEDVKREVETVWHDAKSAVEGAVAALTHHQKK